MNTTIFRKVQITLLNKECKGPFILLRITFGSISQVILSGRPSTLLLRICNNTGTIHRITFNPFSERIDRDLDYIQLELLDTAYSAMNHFLIFIKSDPCQNKRFLSD